MVYFGGKWRRLSSLPKDTEAEAEIESERPSTGKVEACANVEAIKKDKIKRKKDRERKKEANLLRREC